MRRGTLAFVGFLAVGQALASSSAHFLTVADLVCESDVVAIVQITGADTPFGERWIYRARVSAAIRGEKENGVIYFAPPGKNYGDGFTYKLGGDYLVVLDQSKAARVDPGRVLSPADEGDRGQFYEIGWGPTIIMPVQRRCDFENCKREVAVSSAIQLPEDLPSFRSEDGCGHDLEGATWVPEDEFVERLTRASGNCR